MKWFARPSIRFPALQAVFSPQSSVSVSATSPPFDSITTLSKRSNLSQPACPFTHLQLLSHSLWPNNSDPDSATLVYQEEQYPDPPKTMSSKPKKQKKSAIDLPTPPASMPAIGLSSSAANSTSNSASNSTPGFPSQGPYTQDQLTAFDMDLATTDTRYIADYWESLLQSEESANKSANIINRGAEIVAGALVHSNRYAVIIGDIMRRCQALSSDCEFSADEITEIVDPTEQGRVVVATYNREAGKKAKVIQKLRTFFNDAGMPDALDYFLDSEQTGTGIYQRLWSLVSNASDAQTAATALNAATATYLRGSRVFRKGDAARPSAQAFELAKRWTKGGLKIPDDALQAWMEVLDRAGRRQRGLMMRGGWILPGNETESDGEEEIEGLPASHREILGLSSPKEKFVTPNTSLGPEEDDSAVRSQTIATRTLVAEGETSPSSPEPDNGISSSPLVATAPPIATTTPAAKGQNRPDTFHDDISGDEDEATGENDKRCSCATPKYNKVAISENYWTEISDIIKFPSGSATTSRMMAAMQQARTRGNETFVLCRKCLVLLAKGLKMRHRDIPSDELRRRFEQVYTNCSQIRAWKKQNPDVHVWWRSFPLPNPPASQTTPLDTNNSVAAPTNTTTSDTTAPLQPVIEQNAGHRAIYAFPPRDTSDIFTMHFDRASVFSDLASRAAWDEYARNDTVNVTGVFDWLLQDEVLRRLIDTEFIMYLYHVPKVASRPQDGRFPHMWHSMVQNVIRQDPVLYALTACTRPDDNVCLVSYPYWSQLVDSQPGTSERITINVDATRWAESQTGQNMVTAAVSLDDESETTCEAVVPRFPASAISGFIKRDRTVYSDQDQKELGKLVPVPCRAGGVRLTRAHIPFCSSKYTEQPRRIVSPMYTAVQPGLSQFDDPEVDGYSAVRESYFNRMPPPTSLGPFGDKFNQNRPPYAFPASINFPGVWSVGRAILCQTSWDDPAVVFERDVILGPDNTARQEKIRRVRTLLASHMKLCWRMIKQKEMAVFGTNSFFRVFPEYSRANRWRDNITFAQRVAEIKAHHKTMAEGSSKESDTVGSGQPARKRAAQNDTDPRSRKRKRVASSEQSITPTQG
ncbi:hypothetical protein EX30DRAFT_239843 [Ascodesmis nigricans]|uniref:Uncharacterized protein n=1 Tax=Ascodesmis nigricans TaxID=341454 RepID=A0A4S2MZ57_9PEZI|nr:hypothetical protein EX30DRAFT_239843 [Ascodesmis nigricans]